MCYFPLMMCLIFQEFDSVYGNGWQCVVGSNFGCYFTHSSGTFIYFALETLNFLIFKGTSSWFMLCRIWDKIQGLVMREASTCRVGFWFIPSLHLILVPCSSRIFEMFKHGRTVYVWLMKCLHHLVSQMDHFDHSRFSYANACICPTMIKMLSLLYVK